MSEAAAPAIGQIAWVDLTIPNAEAVRAFYEHVTGWSAAPVSMGDHHDCMVPAGVNKPVAGVCHVLGKVRVPARRIAGMGRYSVIEDPAGALAALFQPE